MASQSPLAIEILTQLRTTKSLVPLQMWLGNFLFTQRPSTPIPVLLSSATFRLLASDITQCLEPLPHMCLPLDIENPQIRERRVLGPIVLQVLSVEDMSKSRWQQIEAIEALERGEGTKGREIIRVVTAEDGDNGAQSAEKSNGPHKLLLQDTKGAKVFGVEWKEVQGVGLSMNIGAKLVLKNALVARGVILLGPASTTLLGGKIEALHKAWKDGRKADLKAAIEATEREQN